MGPKNLKLTARKLNCKYGTLQAKRISDQSQGLTSEGKLKRAIGALILFDLTNESSFISVEDWFKEIRNNSSNNVVSILIGNKSDLVDKREVSSERASKFALEHNIKYLEVSSKSY